MWKVLVSLIFIIDTCAYASCFEDAAQRYSVPVDVLKAISQVESGGDAKAINKANSDGSYDIGHMQINSSWLPRLAKYGIDERKLMDPCVNTHIGAWLLAENVYRMGMTWNAVGAYNARSESKRLLYARKVASVLGKIQN